MKRSSLKLIFTLAIIFLNYAQAYPQLYDWRGPDRSGIYPDKNLLKEWPQSGPELLWEVDGIGGGFSSVTISNDAIYITGKKEDVDVLTSLTLDGKKNWETVYGKSWTRTYPDSRCTATYYNGKLFVVSGQGDIVCIDKNGEILWSVNHYEKYEASAPMFGISESPLVVDDNVIVSPGGNIASIVAFDINTGKVSWETESLNEGTQYVNPKLVEIGGRKIIITISSNHIIGVDSKDGNLLWKVNYTSMNEPTSGRIRKNHTITPIYRDGCIFVCSGYDHISAKLKLSDDGASATLLWNNKDIDPHHGGVVLLGNYLFSSNYKNNSLGSWLCVNWETGETEWIADWYNKGSIISADNMLYIYEEKSGHVGLMKPDHTKMEVISEFQITKGEGPFWSHPVIRDGKLYVRHGEYLMVYSISE